jgi:hypothetical protein
MAMAIHPHRRQTFNSKTSSMADQDPDPDHWLDIDQDAVVEN